MSKKRKTRKQKIKSIDRNRHNSSLYTLKLTSSPNNKIMATAEGYDSNYKFKEVKRILLATGVLLVLNTALFLLLSNGIIKLNFLGY